MCINYRALNKVTIKNKYPIPLVADLFDQFGKDRYFTKLDLRSKYWQLRIAEGDEPKTTCVIRYGSFEFLVMPFGLTNAPAIFFTLMNKVFQPFLEDHIQHLRHVLKVLQEYELYVKNEKCSFAQQQVSFLVHRIKAGTIMMEHDKVKAIKEWKPPKNVSELRSYLGLANYYRRFIHSYSARTTPPSDLLKKKLPWH